MKGYYKGQPRGVFELEDRFSKEANNDTFPNKKYSVIYADPPWSYQDKLRKLREAYKEEAT